MTRHLLHVFPSFEVGGAQVRTATWINGLGAEYRHTIVSLDGDTGARDRLDPDLEVTFATAPDAGGHLPGRLLACRRFICAAAPHALITNNWGSIEWALAGHGAGCQLLHVESGFGSEEAERDFPRRALARRFVLAGSTRVVVPSRRLLDRALDSWGLAAGRVMLVPDGIDCALFARAARVPRPPDGRLVVGTVAVLREEKRLDLLIDAFAVLRGTMPASLVIVGDGPEREALVRHAARVGLSADVEFTGFRRDVEHCYAGFDIFALSSETEQMPNSVLQAMAAGLPVVTTAVGDVARMVAEDNLPFVVPPRDVAALAAAIGQLAREPERRAAIGAANRRRAFAAFDVRRMVEAYRHLLL